MMAGKPLTVEQKKARSDHMAEFPDCWLCNFLGVRQVSRTELHHIAGRGRYHEIRENFASLSANMHRVIQSRKDAELICLVLKKLYDPEHYSPQDICALRGSAITRWTRVDVEQCHNVLMIMRDLRLFLLA